MCVGYERLPHSIHNFVGGMTDVMAYVSFRRGCCRSFWPHFYVYIFLSHILPSPISFMYSVYCAMPDTVRIDPIYCEN